jgi:hypothetical protein
MKALLLSWENCSAFELNSLTETRYSEEEDARRVRNNLVFESIYS